MSKRYKHIIAPFLAVLMVMATLTFRADLHFCGDHLVDISFEGSATSCAMMPLDGAPGEACEDLLGIGCCSDLQIAQDSEAGIAGSLSLDLDSQVEWVLAPQWPFPVDLTPSEAKLSAVPYHPSPPLIRDIPVWNQSFLL